MEKTTVGSCILFLTLMVLLALPAPLEAAITLVLSETSPDIVDKANVVFDPLVNGAVGAVFIEANEPLIPEFWFKTRSFGLAAGVQTISFDFGYYNGGGDETDEFNVWLKDSSGNIINSLSSTMDFPWKSSDFPQGGVSPQTQQLVFTSTGGYTGVYLHFHMLADYDDAFLPTSVNISNITLPSTGLPSIPVPAPGALLLGGLGMGLVGFGRRTRRSVFE